MSQPHVHHVRKCEGEKNPYNQICIPRNVFIDSFLSHSGSNKKRNHLNQKVKQPDYKVAYVQLVRTYTQTRTLANLSPRFLFLLMPHICFFRQFFLWVQVTLLNTAAGQKRAFRDFFFPPLSFVICVRGELEGCRLGEKGKIAF